MTRVVVDYAVWAQLSGITEPVQLCDESGRVLGSFSPAEEPLKEWGRPQLPEEELQRRAREGGGRNLAEILSDLAARS